MTDGGGGGMQYMMLYLSCSDTTLVYRIGIFIGWIVWNEIGLFMFILDAASYVVMCGVLTLTLDDESCGRSIICSVKRVHFRIV